MMIIDRNPCKLWKTNQTVLYYDKPRIVSINFRSGFKSIAHALVAMHPHTQLGHSRIVPADRPALRYICFLTHALTLTRTQSNTVTPERQLIPRLFARLWLSQVPIHITLPSLLPLFSFY